MRPELRADKELIDRVLVVLNHFDLEGVMPGHVDGAPLDEYGNEARPIAGILSRNGSISAYEFGTLWTKWFGQHFALLSPSLIDEVIAALDLAYNGLIEPPPVGHEAFHSQYTSPIPFGSPPHEPIALVGEIPWELR
jgi:hypothetical protein